jgi:hypothetical protein
MPDGIKKNPKMPSITEKVNFYRPGIRQSSSWIDRDVPFFSIQEQTFLLAKKKFVE